MRMAGGFSCPTAASRNRDHHSRTRTRIVCRLGPSAKAGPTAHTQARTPTVVVCRLTCADGAGPREKGGGGLRHRGDMQATERAGFWGVTETWGQRWRFRAARGACGREMRWKRASRPPCHSEGSGHSISNGTDPMSLRSARSMRDGRSAMFAADATYSNHRCTRAAYDDINGLQFLLLQTEHFVSVANISGPPSVGKTFACAIALGMMHAPRRTARFSPSTWIS